MNLCFIASSGSIPVKHVLPSFSANHDSALEERCQNFGFSLIPTVQVKGDPVSLINSWRGVTSTHNKQGCAILTKKVVPKNPGTYLKLRLKYPGSRNARLSFYLRKFTTQIRKSLISTPHLSFTYFIEGFYYLTFVL